jgi:anti-sigma regulatory factor (Ser/Thr protein kinase)
MSFSIKLTIQSDTRYLVLLRQMVSAAALLVGRKRFPKRAEGFCTLALIEAVDNAIFHAHHHRAHVPIDIEIEIRKNAIVMSVVDRGPGLNHPVIDVPQPTATKGRGLYMMTKLMDKVETRKMHNSHELILTCRI